MGCSQLSLMRQRFLTLCPGLSALFPVICAATEVRSSAAISGPGQVTTVVCADSWSTSHDNLERTGQSNHRVRIYR